MDRSRARKGLQEQSSEKSPETGKGQLGTAMPRFLVTRIIVGMRERKVARPMCLYQCGELILRCKCRR